MEEQTSREQIATLLTENNRLLTENNKMLKTMRRNAQIGFIFRIVWIAVLIGMPLVLYYYVIAPMLATLPFGGTSTTGGYAAQLEQLQELLRQLPQ
jgi:hypothetical protein